MQRYTAIFIITSILFAACLDPLDFSDYHTPQRLDDALIRLHIDYPGLTQIVTIGTSIEGRPIKGLKISSTPNINDPVKGDVVFVGCHHAREWMSIEVPLYVAVHLLSEYNTNAEVKVDIDHTQIWVIPVLNVDGFQYTQTAVNRYWRKNRRNNGDGTFGVDLNRNYGYQWALTGISGSPVTGDDTYYGPSSFSEPETVAIRDFMLGLGNLKAFFTYHSYGEWHMKPWSYTFSNAPGYTGGLAGFSPAATEIIPTCEENYAAAKAIIHDASQPRVWLRDNAGDVGVEPSSGYPWESPDIWTVPARLNQNQTIESKSNSRSA